MAAMFDQYHHVMLLATTAAMADFPGQSSPLDISDYGLLDEDPAMPSTTAWLHSEGILSSVVDVRNTTASISSTYSGNSGSGGSTGHSSSRVQAPVARRDEDGGARVAFRTKSEVEILDDGYKWRKYGKKSVKNSPNPRNYYRCSTDGCSVKKRVERDPNEPSYVITTYDGVHNHASPDVVYYATQDSESGRFVVSGCHHMPRSS